MTHKKKILILTKRISRNNGGLSSVLDIYETLQDIGYDVHFGLIDSSSVMYLIKDMKHIESSIPFKNIHTIPNKFSSFISVNRVQSDNYFLKVLRYISYGLNGIIGYMSCLSFFHLMKKTDLIIAAVPFKTGAKEYISSISNAKVILNHAGSVDAYENYWLNEDHVPCYSDNRLSIYENYCLQFDKIIFQAKDQAIECINRNKLLEALTVVIKPTSEEKKVILSKNTINPYRNNTFNIVNIGSVQRRKGQEMSVKAFILLNNKNSNMHLHFIGSINDKEYYDEIITIIKKNKIEDKIHFHGHRYDYLKYIAHSDVFLQTSRAEGVSRVLRESMLLKIPIVTFAISGTISILTNKRNALLIEPFDIQEIKKAIEEIYNNPNLVRKLTDSAFNNYLLNYSWSRYADKWLNFIQSNY